MSVVFEKWNGSEWVNVPFTRWQRIVVDSGFMRLIIFSTLSGKALVSGGDQVRVVDGSKVFFRGHLSSGGRVLESGEVRFEADGFGKLVSEAKLAISSMSTSNIGLVSASLDGTGISLDSSGAVSSSITFPGFSGMRHRVWEEMTSFYDHRLIFLPDLTARYETVGALSSGVSVDTSSDNVRVLSYEEDLSDDLLTRVEVVGRDASNNIISATSGDGLPVDVFGRFQVGFVRNVSELQDIADSLLVTEKKDSLKFERFWFEDEVLVNKTMSFVDVPRGIDDVFVVVRQEDFYPQRVSVLTLGTDEDLNSVRRGHRESSNLDEERSTLFEEFLESFSGETESHNHEVSDSGHDHLDPSLDVSTSDIRSDFNFNDTRSLGVSNLSASVSVPNPGDVVENVLIHINVGFDLLLRWQSIANAYVRIRNVSTGKNYFLESGVLGNTTSFSASILVNRVLDDIIIGDTIEVYLYNLPSTLQTYPDGDSESVSYEVSISVQSIGRHEHNKPSQLVDSSSSNISELNKVLGYSGSVNVFKDINLLRE